MSPEHRGAKQRRLSPGHHCSSSGMNLFSTVRPSGDTVANRHELCLRWSYGDSPLSDGVSRRRAGIALTIAGPSTVCNSGSRWTMKHRGFAVLLPWPAVVTPRLCRRFPRQNCSASGCTSRATQECMVAVEHTVINFCPKPGMVHSTIGKIWTVSKFIPVCPGLTAANCRGVHRDIVNEALLRLWKFTLISIDSMIVIYMVVF